MPNELPIHVVIPDTQIKPGVPTAHLRWIGQYLVDHFAGRPNVKVIHLGDHADMPSLSSYDRGKKAMEGRRYLDDVAAANEGWATLNAAMVRYNRHRKTKWWPERHVLLGNHEDRITRAAEDDAQLEGVLSLESLDYSKSGWLVHPYLQPLFLDGIGYAHFWQNPMTGHPYGGTSLYRLKTLGHSFTQGHQQTLDYAVRFTTDTSTGEPQSQHGLIAGACYLHDEDYKGYQGNAHWRGIIVKHQVVKGSYNAMFVDLDYLCQRYEDTTLRDFRKALGYGRP